MKLLHLDSSIQGESSTSRAVSAAIVERLGADDPALEITYHDLAREPLPHLTLEAFAGAQAQEFLNGFLAADVVVIGAAMYNFTVPSQLKAWIDRILVAGQTFRYGATGVEGLAGGKRVIVALARGGLYGDGSAFATFEHTETYLRGVLAFIGITDPEFVIAEGPAMGEEPKAVGLAAALDQARHVAPARIAA